MVRAVESPEAVPVAVEELAAHLNRLCPGHHIDLAGAVALPCPLPHEQKWRRFLADGRHADLEYLIRDPDARLDPTAGNPWARTLLVFAQRYTDGWPAGDPDPSAGGPAGDGTSTPWSRRVARYARGLDYHDVFLKDIKQVVAGLKGIWPGLKAHPATDTGPYLEREYAWLAGLGFLGKNTCLIHEKLGSGLFLGVAPTNLTVAGLPVPGSPAPEPLYRHTARRRRTSGTVSASHCGRCTRCIDACPTGAIGPEGGLDAGQCISTWTIEWQGGTPDDSRHDVGGILFGCDICQAVCPWNERAAERTGPAELRPEYRPLPGHRELALADLLEMNDDDFRTRFRRTPLWRCHPEGLRRNAKVVLENLGELP